MIWLCWLTQVSAGRAEQFGQGTLPIVYDAVRPLHLADKEIHIKGFVDGQAPVMIVLRVDDGQSMSYATRFNDERTLPPGLFHWRISGRGLTTPSGRTLDGNDIRKVVLFSGDRANRVIASEFLSAPVIGLPAGAIGYALGAPNAPLPEGFLRIAPGNPAIERARVSVVRRPAPDPLVANGLRGIERLRLPTPRGRYRITLWTEDPGEWEHLPAVLERRIRINGLLVDQLRRSPGEWLEQRYLRGLHDEHSPSDDAWTAFGQLRGGPIHADVVVEDDGVLIEMAGSSPDATFLSAILIEPWHSREAQKHVEAQRAEWYRNRWPVLKAPDSSSDDRHLSNVVHLDGRNAPAALPKLIAAAGSGVRLTVFVNSERTIATPVVTVEATREGDLSVRARVWVGQRRLQRRNAGDTVLVLSDTALSGAIGKFPIGTDMLRRYELWLDIAQSARPGVWGGLLVVGSSEAPHRIPISVEILPVLLPPAAKPSGFYLDEAPHLTAFDGGDAARRLQIVCDLALMRSFGLTGSAPTMATPGALTGRFEGDLDAAHAEGVSPPYLAYAPAKRLLKLYGVEQTAKRIAAIDAERRSMGRPAIVWSVADEPSNPSMENRDLVDLTQALRHYSPRSAVAGHLNHRDDERRLADFDIAIVNGGFGLDLETLANASSRGRQIWIYNTDSPRLTAGLWLWRSPAERYIQWHARMPTADPLDPTDGREGDVQMLLPSTEVCPAQHSIHTNVLEMAEGVVDQRWLTWLAHRRDTLRSRSVPLARLEAATSWGQAQKLAASDLQHMRESIMQVARGDR